MAEKQEFTRKLKSRHIQLMALGGTIGTGLFLGSGKAIHAAGPAILLAYLIYRLLKNFPGLDLIDISEFLGGKVFKIIMGIIFITFFFLVLNIIIKVLYIVICKLYIFLQSC